MKDLLDILNNFLYIYNMLKRYIVILITSILIVIFAVQNVEKVAIKLWMFDVDASLSLIIILTFTIGALVTLLLAFQEIRYRNKRISALEDELRSSKKKSSSGQPVTGEFNDKQS